MDRIVQQLGEAFSPHLWLLTSYPTLWYILQCGMVFIESRAFTRRLTDLAGHSADDVLRQMQDELLQNRERGNMVQGLGGIPKARAANPARGKGKKGGYRYLFLYLEPRLSKLGFEN